VFSGPAPVPQDCPKVPVPAVVPEKFRTPAEVSVTSTAGPLPTGRWCTVSENAPTAVLNPPTATR
jgi:hypothetical protein